MANPWAYAYNAVKYVSNVNANVGKAVTAAAPSIVAAQAAQAAAAPTVASTPTPVAAPVATQQAQDTVAAQQAQINDAQDQNMRKAALAAQGGMMSTMRGGGRGFALGRGMTSAITLGGGSQGLGA